MKTSKLSYKDFLICGLTGWCLEILFTSAGTFFKKDTRLIGQTSLWMFPIYSMAAIKGKSLSRVRLFTTPWTAAYQAPPSMGFSRQEYWSGVPSPSLRKVPGIW